MPPKIAARKNALTVSATPMERAHVSHGRRVTRLAIPPDPAMRHRAARPQPGRKHGEARAVQLFWSVGAALPRTPTGGVPRARQFRTRHLLAIGPMDFAPLAPARLAAPKCHGGRRPRRPAPRTSRAPTCGARSGLWSVLRQPRPRGRAIAPCSPLGLGSRPGALHSCGFSLCGSKRACAWRIGPCPYLHLRRILLGRRRRHRCP